MLDQAAQFLPQVVFVLVAVLTAAEWAHTRSARSRDAALMFGTLAVVILLQWFSTLSTVQSVWLTDVGAVAVLALLLCLVLMVRLRRVRADQRVIMGDGSQDLVAHAAALRQQFEALYEWVQDVVAGITQRMQTAEQRLDQAIAYSALVRYDAYGEMSGRQSTTIALLDARRSGLVLSSIHHRDQARLYAKQVHEGQPELELSPEESEAIRLALEGGTPEQARL